jgi:hypothetical protein
MRAMSERTDEVFPMVKVSAALDAVTAALDGLRESTTAGDPLETMLRRLAHTTVYTLDDADAVSVTRVDLTTSATIATTDPAVVPIDEHQYAANRGPCLEAARTPADRSARSSPNTPRLGPNSPRPHSRPVSPRTCRYHSSSTGQGPMS